MLFIRFTTFKLLIINKSISKHYFIDQKWTNKDSLKIIKITIQKEFLKNNFRNCEINIISENTISDHIKNIYFLLILFN